MEKKEIITKMLEEHSDGLTIQELVDKTNVTRNTVATVLAELKGEGRLRIREIGQAKLHFIKDNKRGDTNE